MDDRMPAYPDMPNPDLLDRIPLDARVVLDVGCGSGALGAAYKRRNPVCRVLGIESDPEAARLAATRLDDVVNTDVEADPMPFPGVAIDCIIYGDVLEHLRDPWRVLKRQAQALSPRGMVLICMPNVEHWSFAERLLRGTFAYEDQGLFDRTHLRWFTLDTMKQALISAGLVPYSAYPRVFGLAEAQGFAKAMAPALAELGIDEAAYLRRAAPIQHVWRAGLTEIPRLHVVSTALVRVGGVTDVRVVEPMGAIATNPAILPQIVADSDNVDLPDDAPKIFIFHRPVLAGPAGLRRIRSLLDRGYLIVCEFDDHPDYIPVTHRPDILNFTGVHAVQTTTATLAALFQKSNPEVAVFPNAIRHLPDVRNYSDPGRLTVFFGGLNRQADWPPVLAGLNAAAAQAGEMLHFSIVHDRALFDALQTDNKIFTPLCDYATYNSILGAAEISFMPLNDIMFNHCKSDLKYIEAASHRVTPLASTVVYGDVIQNNVNGLLFENAEELRAQLMGLVSQPALGRDFADAARRDVARHRMLAYQVNRRIDWYKSLWNRRDALRRDLLVRLPELATDGQKT
jgi:SAM-dependent methyltransferase